MGWAPNQTVSGAQLATGKKVKSVFLKSVDTGEMQYFVAFHLGLHRLSMYPFRGFQYIKSIMQDSMMSLRCLTFAQLSRGLYIKKKNGISRLAPVVIVFIFSLKYNVHVCFLRASLIHAHHLTISQVLNNNYLSARELVK